MKRKILSVVFTISFIISGCGIDSIFNGGLFGWLFAILVAGACGLALFGGRE